MASVLTVQLAMELTGAELDNDNFAPENMELTLAAATAKIKRDSIALSTTPVTLTSGAITPGYWFVKNTHASVGAVLQWGAQDALEIPAGQWCLFPATVDPTADVASGTGSLFYMCWDA